MILAIIQARMGSTRLPGKVLMNLEDKTVIEHVVDRVCKSKLINKIVVATSIDSNNLPMVKLCAEKNISIFIGSEDDVLDRFYQTAKLFNPDHIVRITADCPMMDPNIIDLTIERHFSSKADYTSNTITETFPDGEDVEIFTFNSLKRAWNEAKLSSEREHVTPYIRNNDLFKIESISNKENFSSKRWTLDNREDFEFMKVVFRNLYCINNYFGMDMIVDFLKKNPDIEKINNHIFRNEGYKKSLNEDKKTE